MANRRTDGPLLVMRGLTTRAKNPMAQSTQGGPKKVIALVQFQNTQTLTVNKLNFQR